MPASPSERFIAAAAVVILLVIGVFGLGQPLLERHAFRQTQTALTAQVFQREGLKLAYETPVLGESWSIPFEFPIYQAVVAETSSVLGTPLAPTGRAISLALLMACFVPFASALRRLGAGERAITWACALFATSPVYLFWSNGFMIESAALFFTLCALATAARLWGNPASLHHCVWLAVWLTLALLQKITTALPPAMIIAPLLAGRALMTLKGRHRLIALAQGAAAFAIPLTISAAWIAFSDVVKGTNPIAAQYVTSHALSSWTYGTLAQRFSGELWSWVVYERSPLALFGLLLPAAALLQRSDRNLTLIAVALFLAPLLIFTNLQIQHDYYQMSVSVFLAVAVAILGEGLTRDAGQIARTAVLSTLVLAQFAYFTARDLPAKLQSFTLETSPTLALAEVIRSTTPPDRPVVIYAKDWTSEYAFYAQRKTLTVPGWGDLFMDTARNPETYLSETPSLFVICPPNRERQDVKDAITARSGPGTWSMAGGCDLFRPD